MPQPNNRPPTTRLLLEICIAPVRIISPCHRFVHGIFLVLTPDSSSLRGLILDFNLYSMHLNTIGTMQGTIEEKEKFKVEAGLCPLTINQGDDCSEGEYGACFRLTGTIPTQPPDSSDWDPAYDPELSPEPSFEGASGCTSLPRYSSLPGNQDKRSKFWDAVRAHSLRRLFASCKGKKKERVQHTTTPISRGLDEAGGNHIRHSFFRCWHADDESIGFVPDRLAEVELE